MKTHTTGFKENISLFGKEIDSKITYELNGEIIELGTEDLNSVTPHYEGAILKSVMKQLDIDSNVEIPLETILTYQFGVKVENSYEYISFGNYVVYSIEKQEDTNSYKIICYDKMLYSMKSYESMNITYPITIKNYINAICNHLGLNFKNANETFANYDKTITSELYLDENGDDLGYTFRDVLDELAQVTASTICINENDDELEIRYINNTKPLPKEYTEVDYIQSDGTQYIDTGINADYKLSIDIKMTNLLPTQKHMGTMKNNNGTYIRHHFQTAPSNNQGYVSYYVETTRYDLKQTSEIINPHIYKIDVYNKKIKYDNEQEIEIQRTDFDTQLNYWLFWRNRNENLGAQDKGNFRIYYCKMYVQDVLVRDFIPCYRNSDNEVGIYDLVNDTFYTNNGTGTFTYGKEKYDTIDEEYLKDVNVNFGEKFGPVNTIVLSRSAGADNIYYPSVLPENPYELKISDNQIMNGNDRADYMPDIYNKLNGLEYYINDFSSPGIAYYNLCDRYNVKISNNTYSCVIFNDELIVTQGLEENIYTEMPEQTETDYTKADKTDRKINQTILSVDKQNQKIEAKVSKDGIIADLNVAIVDGQGVINATGNKFILDADNASIDEYGNAEFNNATLRGGDLILEDNGGESSSIQIHALNSQDSKVIMEQDLSNVTMTIKEPKNFTISSLPVQDILLTTDGGFEIAIQPIVDDDYNYSIYTTNPSQELTKLKIESFDFDYELYRVKDYSIINTVQTNANTGSVDFINSENPFSNLIRIVGTESIDKISKYSSSGIDLDIYNSYATNNGYIPTQEEIDEVKTRIAQGDTFTQEEIEKYDCNNDGVITPADLLALKKIMLTGATMTQPAHFSINTETSNQALGVEEIMNLKDGNGNSRVALGINGIYFKGNNLIGIEKIWDGNVETTTSGLYMNGSQTINLSKKISDCLKGITLVWYGYDPTNMTRVNTVVSKQFISKEDIANNINHHVTTMAFIKYTHVGTKLVIVYDDRIDGHISNVQNGTANGITYENKYFVLGDIYAE